jgi:predicted GNAT superfamily acetyltransferase
MCIPVFFSDTLGVTFSIKMLTSLPDIKLGCEFFASVWGGEQEVVLVDIAIASGHAGGYFSGAFDAAGSLVGASYGFVAKHGSKSTLHSHVTASIKAGAGFELKQHQRKWAREQGFEAITWTFDPLVRRNCAFNFEKLGATAQEYLINFYGVMNDALNADDESDRLLAVWPVQADKVDYTTNMASEIAVAIAPNGSPVVSANYSDLVATRSPLAVYLPEDIELLRQTDPTLAKTWRLAVRQALDASFATGASVRRMIDNRAALLVEWNDLGA